MRFSICHVALTCIAAFSDLADAVISTSSSRYTLAGRRSSLNSRNSRRKLRKQRSSSSDNEDDDPEIAEAMKLAEQAETEVMNEGASDVSTTKAPAVAVDAQWSATVREAIKSLAPNASNKMKTRKPATTELHRRAMTDNSKVSRKAPDPVQGVLDHHAAIRSAVRTVVGTVSAERQGKRREGRSENRRSSQTGNVPKDPVPEVSYVASPEYTVKKLRAHHHHVPHKDAANFDVAIAYEDAENGMVEDQASLSVVSPGLASGEAVPYTPVQQHEKEQKTPKKSLRAGALPVDSDASESRALHEVEELEEKIAKETNSESLALMLGGAKMDLYQLNEKVDMLQKDIDNGVVVDPHGSIHEDLVYPLSVSMKCVFLLAAQYFILYTALAICKAFIDMFELGQQYTRGEKALRSACDATSYAPMLCVLFVGAHLRALQISLGRRGPQEWAETAILICTWSVIIQTMLVLAIPAFINEDVKRPQDASLAQRQNSNLAGLLTFFRYLTLAGLYAGFILVCLAVVFMDAQSLGMEPLSIWDDPTTAEIEYAPPVSIAMRATIALTFFFFFVHLLHAVVWTCKELAGGPQSWAAKWEKCLDACISIVNLAPMLCVLFIAARMRALQMDPQFGRPQQWVEVCFGICVVSIILQTFLIILAHVLGGRSVATELSVESSRPRGAQKIVFALSYLVMGVTYVASGVVLYGIFSIEAKDGKATPPLSPTMISVMTLLVLYLGVYFFLFMVQIATESGAGEHPGSREATQRMMNMCKMAENTVKFGPMLAVLFVAARVRALQLSQQQGSPQCWAQDAMYVACAAVAIQLLMVIIGGALSSTVEVDESGNLHATKVRYLPGRIFLECLKAITFLMLHGGVLVVVTSILVIRPETAMCVRH